MNITHVSCNNANRYCFSLEVLPSEKWIYSSAACIKYCWSHTGNSRIHDLNSFSNLEAKLYTPLLWLTNCRTLPALCWSSNKMEITCYMLYNDDRNVKETLKVTCRVQTFHSEMFWNINGVFIRHSVAWLRCICVHKVVTALPTRRGDCVHFMAQWYIFLNFPTTISSKSQISVKTLASFKLLS